MDEVDDQILDLPREDGATGHLLSVESLTGQRLAACLAADPDWTTDVAVALGLTCGVAPHGVTVPESELAEAVPASIRWLLSADTSRGWPAPPEILIRQDPGPQLGYAASGLPTAFAATDHLLTELQWKFLYPQRLLLVVGDSAGDFALALLWDRLYGFGRWIPQAWLNEHNETVLEAVCDLVWTTKRTGRIRLEVVSLGERVQLRALCDSAIERLSDRDAASFFGEPDPADEIEARRAKAAANYRSRLCVVERPVFPRAGRKIMALRDEPERLVSFPAHSTTNDGFVLAVRPDAILPKDVGLANTFPAAWQVDVDWIEGTAPTGRRLGLDALIADGDSPWETWVRASRHGTTFEAGRYDFASMSPLASARLARPRLRQLSLMEWVEARAKELGQSVRLSAAGRRAQVLSAMCGGRAELCAIFGTGLRDALRAFQASSRTSSVAYPNNDGWVLDGREGFLTFAGLETHSGMQPAELRSRVDELLEFNILRAGLILDCGRCGRSSFYSLEDLSPRYDCKRCAFVNHYGSVRWRSRGLEPTWFYDLHPVARDLLKEDGDVPLLLAEYLRRGKASFSDVSEVEMADGTGSVVSETDLIANVGEELLVAEAKSNGSLGAGNAARTAARKRVEVARLLGADEIVLGTTATWNASSIRHMCEQIRTAAWGSGQTPLLRVIENLGTAGVIDEVVSDLKPTQREAHKLRF